jgi:hypothetical protein
MALENRAFRVFNVFTYITLRVVLAALTRSRSRSSSARR